MIEAGALEVDPGADMAMHRFGGIWPKVSVGLTILSFSRPLLDSVMRRRSTSCPMWRSAPVSPSAGLLGSGERASPA